MYLLLVPLVIPRLDLHLNDDLKATTVTVSVKLSKLPITIHCQTQADDISGQTERMLDLPMMIATAEISDASGTSMRAVLSETRMLTISNLFDCT